jgi:hypothetical protein
MNDFIKRYGEWALIAGAAEGIGEAFSLSLAERGMNLIMIDIKSQQMNTLAATITKLYNSKILCITSDLREFEASSTLPGIMRDLDCRLLIYVPAYSEIGSFRDISEKTLDSYLSLNVRTPIHMVHTFLNQIKDGKSSGIILMSSLAALIGPALSAPYAASKAFSLILAESLFYELKKSQVDILACCAGPTSTPTFWKNTPAGNFKGIKIMRSSDVAEYAIKKLGSHFYCIPGFRNRVIYFFLTRFLPKKIAGRIVSNSMLKLYDLNP